MKFLKKYFVHLLPLVVLILSFSAVLLALKNRQDLRNFAAESRPVKKPEFKEGEVIVKFKKPLEASIIAKNKRDQGANFDNSEIPVSDIDQFQSPKIIQTMISKHKLKNIGKVFRGKQDSQTELNKTKSLFSKDLSEGKKKINEKVLSKIDLSRTYRLKFDSSESLEKIYKELKDSNDVEYVQPNYIYRTSIIPNDPYFNDSYPNNVSSRDPNWNPPYDYQWNLKLMKADAAWNIATGSGNIAAIIDTGVDYTHIELGGCTLDQVNNNLCSKITPGYNFVANNNNPIDDNGHGTHIAGIIGAIANNSTGIAGIGWSTRMMPVKGINNLGEGNDAILANAIVFATDNGASIINMSWGNGSPIPQISQTLKDALDYSFNQNVVLIAAAGNNNDDVTKGYWPANYKYVMSIGAYIQDYHRASYSNYGKVDVMAPGGEQPYNLLSLNAHDPVNPSKYLNLGGAPVGNGYLRLAGTSMAAPHIAGLASLILSYKPTLTNLEVESLIEYKSRQIFGTTNVGYDSYYGWGSAFLNYPLDELYQLPISIPPIAEIYTPTRNEIVRGQYQITGSVTGDQFKEFRISAAEGDNPTTDPAVWKTDGITLTNSGTSPISEGVLGVFDTNAYQDKTITLRLEVENQVGKIKKDYILIKANTPIIPMEKNIQVNSPIDSTPIMPSGYFDENNNYYVAWLNSGSADIYYNKSTDRGLTFSQNVLVNTVEERSAYSPAVIANGNYIYVIFESHQSGLGKIMLKRSAGSSFQTIDTIEIPNVVKPKLDGRFMGVRVDKAGNYLFITWQAGNIYDDNLHIYFSRYNLTTNLFEETKLIQTISSNTSGIPADPTIVSDANGNTYIVWTEQDSASWYRLRISKSADNGHTFSVPSVINNIDTQDHQYFPYVGIDKRNGQIYLTFAAGSLDWWQRDVWVSKSTDGGVSFIAPYNITQKIWNNFWGAYYQSPIVVNATGDVYVQWLDAGNGGVYLIKGNNTLTKFSEIYTVSPDALGFNLKSALIRTGSTDVFSLYDFSNIYSRKIDNFNIVPTPTPTPFPIPSLPPLPSCPSNTPFFSEYYGSAILNGQAIPLGTKVWVVSPRSEVVGCFTATSAGYYGFMRAIGEDPGVILGMKDGEQITFYIGQNLANTVPSPIIWHNDWDNHQVNLNASGIPSNFGMSVRFIQNPACSNIAFPASDKLLMGDNFSVEFWLKPDSGLFTNGSAANFFLSKKSDTFSLAGYNFSAPLRKTLNIILKLQNPDGSYFTPNQVVIGNNNVLSANIWHFIKLNKQGNTFTLFVNDVQVGSLIINSSQTLTEKNILPLVLGELIINNSCITDFKGEVDEMRISNIARVDNNVPTAPFTPDVNTMALWHFDGNANDDSGNNLNGIENGEVQYISYVASTIARSQPIMTIGPLPTKYLSPTPTIKKIPSPTKKPTVVPLPTKKPTPIPSPTKKPIPTRKPSPTPLISRCKKGETNPYNLKIWKLCIKINACGKSTCK